MYRKIYNDYFKNLNDTQARSYYTSSMFIQAVPNYLGGGVGVENEIVLKLLVLFVNYNRK